MDAVPVDQTSVGVRQISVPDLVCTFWKVETSHFTLAGGIEQTKLNSLGVTREQSKVCS
jgi:hypothetical protein